MPYLEFYRLHEELVQRAINAAAALSHNLYPGQYYTPDVYLYPTGAHVVFIEDLHSIVAYRVDVPAALIDLDGDAWIAAVNAELEKRKEVLNNAQF